MSLAAQRRDWDELAELDPYWAICTTPGKRFGAWEADEFFETYRNRPDFIQTYIFPGGMLLSQQRLGEQCRKAGLKIAELYSFGLDYAHTLETWLGRFDQVADQVASLGFDERFRRMWRYYLAYCAAGFSTRAGQAFESSSTQSFHRSLGGKAARWIRLGPG